AGWGRGGAGWDRGWGAPCRSPGRGRRRRRRVRPRPRMTELRVRLAVLALAMLAAAACESPSTPEARPQPGARPAASADVTPTIVNPEYRTRQRTIETTGKVQFNEESLVRIHAPATGRVLEIFA